MDEKVLSETGSTNKKAVYVNKFNGKNFCHIRKLFRLEGSEVWQYGKGVALNKDELKELVDSKALEKALSEM